MRAVSWNTCNKDNSITTATIKVHYYIGHDTYFEQMLASTETSTPTAKRQDITYVGAAPH